MMLLGVLYDLSARELWAEIRMHACMRWFCGQNFHDPVPDHSMLSRLRNERWAESGLFDRLRSGEERAGGQDPPVIRDGAIQLKPAPETGRNRFGRSRSRSRN